MSIKTGGNKMDWKAYLGHEINCSCKKVHKCLIEKIIVEKNALYQVPKLLKEKQYKNIWLIQDENTRQVAGEQLIQLLESAKIHCNTITLEKDFVPDERAIGIVLTKIDRNCDYIVAVGSGTINDLCKFISFQLKIDYIIVATAPSMDGYASNVTPLITENLKTTYEVGLPKMIIGDLTILSKAPLSMIAAGVGDILGKYICLTDWKLAHLIQEEYICEFVIKLVQESIQKVVQVADKIKSRQEEAICSVMEGLILSGIAMSYIGNSRPASGSEHHLSHYWEMMFLFRGEHNILHGTKVGIGTVKAIELYQSLKEQDIDFEQARKKHFDIEIWKQDIENVYQSAAKGVIALEEKYHKNSDDSVQKRLNVIEKNWGGVIELINSLPKKEEIISILNSMDAPYFPEQIGVDDNLLADSIRYAKELRNRYGLLQLLFDLDKLP